MNINRISSADMLNDKEITDICDFHNSPFALYDGESVKVLFNDNPISLHITDTDKQILTLINKYRILTSGQIITALEKFFCCSAKNDALKLRLKKLVKADYVQMSEIMCDDGKVCTARFYSSGYRGRGLLKALGETTIASYISQIADCAESVKKIASCNQFLIMTGLPYDNVQSGFVIAAQPKTEVKGDLVFRPTAVVNCERTLLVESVRRNADWSEKLDDKLGRMKKTLKKRNVNHEVCDPLLIIVCEDAAQMKRVLEYTAAKKLPLEVCCTCDALTYNVPDSCLYGLGKKGSIFGVPFRAA